MKRRSFIKEVLGGGVIRKRKRQLFYEFTKRIIDIVFSLVFLGISAPLVILAGILMQLESPGPLFYLQKRVGLNGRIFHVVKLRSMSTDAENNGPMLSREDDDLRVGRIGRFIRKSKVDELTQFLNVLVGQMSIVGPRPERPYFVNKFIRDYPEFNLRNTVKPGITGLAQFKKIDAFQVQNKLRLDLFYIEHRSIGFDMKIVLHTFVFCFSNLYDATRNFNGANGNGHYDPESLAANAEVEKSHVFIPR